MTISYTVKPASDRIMLIKDEGHQPAVAEMNLSIARVLRDQLGTAIKRAEWVSGTDAALQHKAPACSLKNRSSVPASCNAV